LDNNYHTINKRNYYSITKFFPRTTKHGPRAGAGAARDAGLEEKMFFSFKKKERAGELMDGFGLCRCLDLDWIGLMTLSSSVHQPLDFVGEGVGRPL